MAFFNFIELEAQKLSDQIRNWLRGVYNKSDLNFTNASPHGQIVNVQEEFFQHTMLHLKNSVNQIDIENTFNEKAIRSIARISGHNASRAVSATGVLKLRIKSGVNLLEDVGTTSIVIPNETVIKNNTNGLNYTILSNDEFSSYNFGSSKEIYLNLIQGKYEVKRFTGNGLPHQSFSIEVSNLKKIDNFEVYVTYNDYQVTLKDDLYDLLPTAYECFVKTGMNGGVDVYFGTNDFGFIPSQGSRIEIKFLLTDGTDGNITNLTLNDFKFVDEVSSSVGDVISVEDYFDITIDREISFSSNGESTLFTKNILPYVSRNFVLATPNQFIYHLKRLNMFSKVNAYNLLNDYDEFNKNKIINELKNDINDNIINNVKRADILNKITYLENLNISNDDKMFLYLVPDITRFFTSDVNYFNAPLSIFYLDNDEQNKVMKYLKKMGILMLTSDVEIIQPTITRYIANIFVRRYSDTVEENVREEIIEKMSNYFINNQRFDRVIKADIIKTLKFSNNIDSIDIYFISEKNESYHKDGQKTYNTAPKELEKASFTKNNVMYQLKKYDKKIVLGLDSSMGDIVIGKDELPIIRGGWIDRNGLYYNETPMENGLGPVNIIFKGVSERKTNNN
jgi:hypothetical protein